MFLNTMYYFYLNQGTYDSVGRVTGLLDGGSRAHITAGRGDFSILHIVQTGSRAHPALRSVGANSCFPDIFVRGVMYTTYPCLAPLCAIIAWRGTVYLYLYYSNHTTAAAIHVCSSSS